MFLRKSGCNVKVSTNITRRELSQQGNIAQRETYQAVLTNFHQIHTNIEQEVGSRATSDHPYPKQNNKNNKTKKQNKRGSDPDAPWLRSNGSLS